MTIKNDDPRHYFMVTLNFLLNGNFGYSNLLSSNCRPADQVVLDFDARRSIIDDFKKNNPRYVNPLIVNVSYIGYEKPSVMLGPNGEIQ